MIKSTLAALALLAATATAGFAQNYTPAPLVMQPYKHLTPMTKGTAVPAGKAFMATCTAAGNLSLTLSDSSTVVVTLLAETVVLPLSVTTVNTAGTTATCTTYNLAG